MSLARACATPSMIDNLAPGSHTLAVAYEGDASFEASALGGLVVTADEAGNEGGSAAPGGGQDDVPGAGAGTGGNTQVPGTDAPVTGSASGPLVITGDETGRVVTLALVLLGAGLAVVLVARRRSSEA